MTDPDDFETAIKNLHGALTLTITTEVTPRGRIAWEASLAGEDFLDGTYVRRRRGTAKTLAQAWLDAARGKGKHDA